VVLADTSVWISHFRDGNAEFSRCLEEGDVAIHPFVIGELACGKLHPRREILDLLRTMSGAVVASDDEVLSFIEAHRLMGTGLGLVDAHLLASAKLTGAALWTLDAPLRLAARKLGVEYGSEEEAP
jgi:hypothetical protein